MATTARAERKPVSFRIPTKVVSMVDSACEITQEGRTEFTVAAMRERAEKVLQDRTLLGLSAVDYDAFVQALDNPPEPNECLKALARKKPLWER